MIDDARPRVLFLIDETTTPAHHDMVVKSWSVLLPMIESEGWDVTLCTLRGAERVGKALDRRVVGLGMETSWGAPRAIARLSRVLREGRFDLVVGREIIPAIVAGAAARMARWSGRTIFLRCHTIGSAKANLASRLAASLTDVTIGVSEAVAVAAARSDRTDPSRIRVAHLGVVDHPIDEAAVDALRRSLDLDPSVPVVLSVSRLRYEKGIDIFVEAASLIAKTYEGKVAFVVVGSGPEGDSLERLASARGVEIHFVGHQTDVTPWYALADVIVTPSRREAFALTVLEAMAVGRPIVASDVGGMSEALIHGETGFLVPSEDPVAMAESVAILLKDRELRVRFGTAARENYERSYTRLAMVKRWVELWEELVVRSPRKSERV